MQEDNYICRRYEKKLDLIAIHTEHFYHEQKEPMIIVTHTKSASIALIRQGRVTIRSGKHTVEANVGDILSFPKGIFYWAEWEGAPMLEFYSIHYKQPINVSGNVLSRLQRITINPPDADERFSEIHSLISEECSENEVSRSWRAIGLFCQLYSEILPQLETQNKYCPDVLITALRYIENNFKEDFDVKSLAAECLISESRLYYLFRRHLDMTPVQYRTELRVVEASRLLNESKLTIEAVAERCGFNSSNYFRTIFHEITGLSPSEYRRRGCIWEI